MRSVLHETKRLVRCVQCRDSCALAVRPCSVLFRSHQMLVGDTAWHAVLLSTHSFCHRLVCPGIWNVWTESTTRLETHLSPLACNRILQTCMPETIRSAGHSFISTSAGSNPTMSAPSRATIAPSCSIRCNNLRGLADATTSPVSDHPEQTPGTLQGDLGENKLVF